MADRIPTPFVPRLLMREDLERTKQAQTTRPLPQFEPQYHAALTQKACPDDPTIQSNLWRIVAANIWTDSDQFNSVLHFDNCTFALGVQRIDELWQLIESRATEENPYWLFGTMLHTVQDFYSHSNWVELHEGVSPLPVWDVTLQSLPADIVSGTFVLDWPKLCGPNAPTHAQLNKDSPNSDEGAKRVKHGPNADKTLFDLAFAAALQATQVQYARLVALGPRLSEASGAIGQ
jgi:hypothetical protein